MSIFLLVRRCAAQRAVAVAAQAEKKTGLIDGFEPLDVGLIDFSKLFKPPEINFDLFAPMFEARNQVSRVPLRR